MLLIEAKKFLFPEQFYRAWPDVQIVKGTPFSEILQPLLTAMFRQAIVWTERMEAHQLHVTSNHWIHISNATFISEDSSLNSDMKQVLSNCGVQLVTVPEVIWRAIQFARVSITMVSPMLARSKLHSYPDSYSRTDYYGKIEILTYCLSDNCYSDLSELKLLPLADGTFTTFDNCFEGQAVYLCSSDCPRSLLPYLKHLLVDLSDDPSLQMALSQVATSQQTKLRVLTERDVATLLPQAMPFKCKHTDLVSMPHIEIPSTWLQAFWKWLKNNNLELFNNQLIVPCYSSTSHSTSRFSLTRLNSAQPVVYVSTYYTPCPSSLLSALYKMKVRVCLQSEFSFVQHKQLSSFIREFDPNSVLDAIAFQSNYKSISLTSDEADCLRTFLSRLNMRYTSTSIRTTVLQELAIFSSASTSLNQLYSISSAASQSATRQALGEPQNSVISVSNLPSSLILLSRENYYQLQLLQKLELQFPSDYKLLVNHVLPLIKNRIFPHYAVNHLMCEVLDRFYVLDTGGYLMEHLKNLPFVTTVNGCKTPAELFNPQNDDIAALYKGKDVFPLAPYNTPRRIQVLKYCGLSNTVTPQQVLDIIYSISSPASSYPQGATSTSFTRAKAVLEYISRPSFLTQTRGFYTVAGNRYKFTNALNELATSRSWLPVLSSVSSGYCDVLPWKGSGYNSHFISLSSSVVVLSTLTAPTLPHLIGSQMYIISPTVSPQIAAMLSTNTASITRHVVAHFRVIVACKQWLEIDSLVHGVYSYMNSEGSSYLRQLYTNSVEEWIYIRREDKLVDPAVVALRQNSTFRRDLEPYVYILPDSLSRLTTLFGPASRVNPTVSQDQILSILTAIREEVESETQRTSAEEAWDLVVSILNWLTSNGYKHIDRAFDVYVPVETDSEWPKLVRASKIVYSDSEFMKNHFQFSDNREKHFLVHERISTQLAQALNVVSLSEFLGISSDTFQDAGQYEPLTTRLQNILRDYKDGLTIIKELLQNADDAEATEVNICYDTRHHETNPKKLFFSGMAEAHGPALVVHNNRTFSEDDFTNITKLAGATKQGKALKIGKFGLGFCSVYHMTDIPSFISCDKLFVFDPTLKYLKKAIKNSAQPGKKILYTDKYISSSGQLSPYDGLFGFDRTKSYCGTMFRLPFRTCTSELSKTCYNEATVRELISAIRENSTNLLLFLQHVRTITFQRIDRGQSAPQVVLNITRRSVPSGPSLPYGTKMRTLSCTSHSNKHSSCQWLISQKKEKDSTASVACSLGSSVYQVDPNLEGEVFCFLPLSQKTGLPVHISSNFAVINNRRGIWTSDEATSQTDKEVEWNITLMKGVISKAYLTLLHALKQIMINYETSSVYNFHCLWPKEEELLQHNPWKHMIAELYSLISKEELFYSAAREQWLKLTDSNFLEPAGIMCLSSDMKTPACILSIVQCLNVPLVDLPQEYYSHFYLENLIIGEAEFIERFFTNITSLISIASERNEVIRCMLEYYMANIDRVSCCALRLDHYFRQYPSIPCCPDGMLRKCSEIIDPNSEFAGLFDEEEALFPLDVLTEREISLAALHKLGMLSKTIPWTMLIERAQTISTLHETKALKRAKLIIEVCTHASYLSSDNSHSSLSDIPFLPALGKPTGYHLSWKGEGHHELMCGRDLTLPVVKTSDNREIAGSQVIFMNTGSVDEGGCGNISEESVAFLGINLSPTINEVVLHFREIVELFSSQQLSEELTQSINQMCLKIYEFFDNWLKNTNFDTTFVEDLLQLPCIWTGTQFIRVNLVARDWTRNGPYLFELPSSLSFHKTLANALEIKKEFTLSNVQDVLSQMKEDFDDNPISEPAQEVFKKLIVLLEESDSTEDILMLPDEDFVMHPANELTFNDAPWTSVDSQYTYVNKLITRQVALKFKVMSVRSKILDKFDSSYGTQFQGIPFGQREDLICRIRNILEGYPLDITVLKELLQNADDAKATKMYVILDERMHGRKAVPSENWEKLQGPALLVWNDSEFSDKDLKGIQEVGLGSKRSDAETIGQYGIGFNAVYHLTDCPSFITGGETLCVLDPHCHFIPGADVCNPGRQFDHLVSRGFWDKFKDMKSAYLQSGLNNCPSEVQKGSLFRFPLRCTPELVAMSKIISARSQPKPLTANGMYTNLKEWAPLMKEAMLFLNHVTEIRFFVIEENSHSLITMNNYRTKMGQSAKEGRVQLHNALSAFKQEAGGKSSLVFYPLTISTVTHKNGGEKCMEEKWLIQQGVGDVENDQQTWMYIQNIKPRHGIAAPLEVPSATAPSDSSSATRLNTFNGRVFCFLPLPVESNLPVHINGQFALDPNRRELWHSTDSKKEDNKTAWNRNLFQAIASSYAQFLEHVRKCYASKEQFKSYHDAFEALKKYYAIFPTAYSDTLERQYLTLAESVYTKMVTHNPTVLAVIHKFEEAPGSKKFRIKWLSIRIQEPSSQVYFWSTTSRDDETRDYERKHIKPLLEAIGMQLTAAPLRIQDHLNKAISDEKNRIERTNAKTVYSYYQMFNEQAITTTSESDAFPCLLDSTVFKRAEVFKRFTDYLLQSSGKFSDTPFGHPLLLTADNVLRRFDASHKVLVSNCSPLFQKMLHLFLHPKLLKVSYDKEYLAQSSDYEALVVDILTVELPVELRAFKVQNYAQFINKERLMSLWKCFKEDNAFSSELDTILKHFALIPSNEGHLYSTTSEVLPVYPLVMHDEEYSPLPSNSTVSWSDVLAALSMPFIDTELIAECSISCPHLTDHVALLKGLYFLSKEVPISNLLTEEMIQVIFHNFHSIDFREDEESLRYIQSLPLFENIDGTFGSIEGKMTYKWNSFASTVGYKKWISRFDVIFLHYDGAWTTVGTEQLKICIITAEEIYSKYIFVAFNTMSEEDERYKHLEHIKDVLFWRNFNPNKTSTGKGTSIAHSFVSGSFVSGLKKLACIGRDDEPLRPVKDFCDHTCSIFTAFEKKYRFLPAFFTENEEKWHQWQHFFKKLNLRQTISKKEFLSLCWLVAFSHEDPEKTSCRLLKFLFSDKIAEEGWHNDRNFLREVSDIAFFPLEELPELSWIKSPCQSAVKGRRLLKGGKQIKLTKLSGTALLDLKNLLWTIKPIIKLPVHGNYLTKENEKILYRMDITSVVTVQNVLDNIKNISSISKFSDFEVFSNDLAVSNEPPNLEGVIAKSLTEVMQSQLQFLQACLHRLSLDDKEMLENISCIPVPIIVEKSGEQARKIILVKPCVVIDGDTNGFHPFLHSVPSELDPYMAFLHDIGVCKSVSIKHCQLALELAHEHSHGQTFDKFRACIVQVLRHLRALLKTSEGCSRELSPLYLPSSEGTLALSTTLLYADSSSFYGQIKDNLGYSLVRIAPDYEYGFSEKEFCDALPKLVRPKGMSEVCKHTILPEFKDPIAPSVTHTTLEKTLSMKDDLAKAMNSVVKYHTQQSDVDIVHHFEDFVTSIKIITVQKVRTAITLKTTGALIGQLDLGFHLQYEQHQRTTQMCLYIKSNPDEIVTNSIIGELSGRLVEIVKRMYPALNELAYQKITMIFTTLLRLQTPAQPQQALKREGIPHKTDSAAMEEVTLELGKEVPEDQHHRLNQSISSTFHLGELVGYEDEEDHIIVACIMHPVLPQDDSFDSVQHVNMKYRIYTSAEDTVGIVVGILHLFKFLRGQITKDVQGFVLLEGGTDSARLQRSPLEKDNIIAELMEQLNEIWKLSDKEQNQAIKRLYLKWHPDKNPDNQDLAEEVFKFLNSEIDRRKSGGISLDDLNETVHKHTHNFSREYYHRQKYSSFTGAHGGAENERSSDGSFRRGEDTGHSDPFTDQKLQPKPNLEEGKRWLKQAKANFVSLCTLFDAARQKPEVCGEVCFMAQQVAEKALKGGKYFVCGLDSNSLHTHHLSTHAYGLESERPGETRGLTDHASLLEDYYLNTRYPNCWPPGKVPADQYNFQQAEAAKNHAQAILDIVRHIVED